MAKEEPPCSTSASASRPWSSRSPCSPPARDPSPPKPYREPPSPARTRRRRTARGRRPSERIPRDARASSAIPTGPTARSSARPTRWSRRSCARSRNPADALRSGGAAPPRREEVCMNPDRPTVEFEAYKAVVDAAKAEILSKMPKPEPVQWRLGFLVLPVLLTSILGILVFKLQSSINSKLSLTQDYYKKRLEVYGELYKNLVSLRERAQQ